MDRRGEGPAVEGVERFAADVSTVEGARAAIAGAAVVYHCVNVAYHLQVEVMPRVQEAVLAAVEETGARLVVLDTLYPYGATGGAVMTEDSPWRRRARKGRMRARTGRAVPRRTPGRRGAPGWPWAAAADFVGPGVLNSSLGAARLPRRAHR